jgi:hypothetical protein
LPSLKTDLGITVGLGGKKYRHYIKGAFDGHPMKLLLPFAGLPIGGAMQAVEGAIEVNDYRGAVGRERTDMEKGYDWNLPRLPWPRICLPNGRQPLLSHCHALLGDIASHETAGEIAARQGRRESAPAGVAHEVLWVAEVLDEFFDDGPRLLPVVEFFFLANHVQ